MALTVTPVAAVPKQPQKVGQLRMTINDVTFDSSYAGSGGETLTAAQLGLSVVHAASIGITGGGYLCRYNASGAKLLAFGITVAGGAAAASTDAISMKSSVIGKEAATDMTAALGEVVAGKDLSAVTCRIVAFGE